MITSERKPKNTKHQNNWNGFNVKGWTTTGISIIENFLKSSGVKQLI